MGDEPPSGPTMEEDWYSYLLAELTDSAQGRLWRGNDRWSIKDAQFTSKKRWRVVPGYNQSG